MALQTYTVVGLYTDNDQRFATTVEARDPAHAEELAQEEADSEIIVAAVIKGDVEIVA